MKITRIYMDNYLQNYSHLIACEETNEAIVVDPLDADKCLAAANEQNLTIKKIVNTHEHFDHIEGNPGIVAATNAKILVHYNAAATVPNVSSVLKAGDTVTIGTSVELTVLHTPGHTNAHLCLLYKPTATSEQPILICGDTLFNACAGNCLYGDNVAQMYQTFAEQLSVLSDETAIYPGHDYIIKNLKFALSIEPDNHIAKQLLAQVSGQTPNNRIVTNMGLEKQINPFFRLDNPQIFSSLKQHYPDLDNNSESIFTALRLLRDKW